MVYFPPYFVVPILHVLQLLYMFAMIYTQLSTAQMNHCYVQEDMFMTMLKKERYIDSRSGCLSQVG